MKIKFILLFTTISLIAILFSCNGENHTSKKCFIIQDFDGTNFIFFLPENDKLCLPDMSFINNLPVGIIVTKDKLSVVNADLFSFVKVPNTNRDTAIFGNLDKFYTMYFAKCLNYSYKTQRLDTISMNLSLQNKLYKLKLTNPLIDSIDISPYD